MGCYLLTTIPDRRFVRLRGVSLLTGKHTGHAYIRGNDEWKARGNVWSYQAMFDDPNLEGQRPLPIDSVSIGDLLQAAGYQTAIIGKWGLGGPTTEGIPNNQGFDYFYGYNCQRQAHTLYPKHLWENENKIILDNPMIAPHTKLNNPDQPNDSTQYEMFTGKAFAPTLMGQKPKLLSHNIKKSPSFYILLLPSPMSPFKPLKNGWITTAKSWAVNLRTLAIKATSPIIRHALLMRL